MKEIQLTQGKVALVDDEDFEYLNQWRWKFHHNYAIRTTKKLNICCDIAMHRIIMKNTDINFITDHINGNTLDNRKCNLRLCNKQQNSWNRKIHKNNSSGYKGVIFIKSLNKYKSLIIYNKKLYYLGVFYDKKDAAKAYNKAAIKFFGEFAKLNEI